MGNKSSSSSSSGPAAAAASAPGGRELMFRLADGASPAQAPRAPVAVRLSDTMTAYEMTLAFHKALGLPPSCEIVGCIRLEYEPLVPLGWFVKLKDGAVYSLVVCDRGVPAPLSEPLADLPYAAFEDGPSASRARLARLVLDSLRAHSFLRVSVGPDQVAVVREAHAAAGAFFARPAEEKRPRKLLVSPGSGSEKFVGWTGQPGREWFQVRRHSLRAAPFPWPEGDGGRLESALTALFRLLDSISRGVLTLIAEGLSLPPATFTDLLDPIDPFPDDAYGSDVMRLYQYHSQAEKRRRAAIAEKRATAALKAREGAGGAGGEDPAGEYASDYATPLPPRDARGPAAVAAAFAAPACGVHADLGLVTVSPPSSSPGLVVLDPSVQAWVDVESNAGEAQFSVFVGETLGLLTNGALRATLHYVNDATIPEAEARYSCPYFCRGRPGAPLPALQLGGELAGAGPPAISPATVADFMATIFADRPWRPPPTPGREGASSDW
eukprot:tig00000219_g19506.t1